METEAGEPAIAHPGSRAEAAAVTILHIVNLSGRGGMEQLFLSYLDSTRNARPNRACVVTKDDVDPALRPRLEASPAPRYNLKRRGGLRLPPIAGLRRGNLQRILALERPERVVLWSTLPSPALTDACRRHGAEIVYYDHGKAWQVAPAEGRAALAGVTRAITVSHAGRRILQERHGFDGKVEVVPNGLRFTRVPQRLDRPLGDELQIGFAGRLVDHKGIPVLLAAARELVRAGIPFHAHLAGTGPEETALRTLSERRGLAPYVTFHGNVDDMAGFYQAIDILVMPSLREPFGLASIEAAAFGAVPVVARIDGLAETLHHGESGLSVPVTGSLDLYRQLGGHARELPQRVYNPDSDGLRTPGIVEPRLLAAALTELAGQPHTVARLSAAASDFVQNRFSHEQFVERLDRQLYSP